MRHLFALGQLYEPVDTDTLLYYREAKDGQILEEGITEAGSMSSFIAAGTAYATHGINMIPFFIYYSMFGFQRIGDLIWAAADMRAADSCSAAPPAAPRSTAKACSTRTATATARAARSQPACLRSGLRLRMAVIIHDGMKRMYVDGENLLLPHRHEREATRCRRCPKDGSREGIIKRHVRFKTSENKEAKLRAHFSAAARSA